MGSTILSGFFSLGCFVVGRSVPDIQALGAKMGNTAGAVLAGVCKVLPNMSLFYPSGAIVGAKEVTVHGDFVNTGYLVSTTLYGLTYSLLVLGLAMLIFRKRDFV